MPDEHQPEKVINIQSNVTVGTANDKTSVSGPQVTTGPVRELHVHGNAAPPPALRSVALVGVLAFLSAVLVNYATSLPLPESWLPYRWLAWPLALLVTAASIWVVYRQSWSKESNIAFGRSLEQRNRRAMLTKVKIIWIEGLLEQSLAKELRIALDLTEQPDAVDLPLNALVQELNRPSRELPAGTPIISVFDQMAGALLILGAPGAGKTTLLLELTRDLIARAEQDDRYPIPVVFHLSSWAENQQVQEWLVEELNTKYDVPRKLAQAWMDADAVLPLLDGLDEVAAKHRDKCVRAINTYRHEHGLVPIVVCSRVTDYEALALKLRLQGAIVIQSLTQPQIDAYLRRADKSLAGVRATLHGDTELGEMLNTPLMLNIVALAYKDDPVPEPQHGGTLEEQRKHLLNAYIRVMFKRRCEKARHIERQTLPWLCWLANKMTERAQTVFLVEHLQPAWLSKRPEGVMYVLFDKFVFLLGVGLGVGSIVGLGGGSIVGLGVGSIVGLGIALSVGLLGALCVLLFEGQRGIRRLQQRRSGRIIIDALIDGQVVGLIIGLSTGLLGGLTIGLTTELFASPLAVTLSGLVGGFGTGLIGGLVGGLVNGLVGGLVGELRNGLKSVVLYKRSFRHSVQIALGIGLLGGLGIGLLGGLGIELGIGLGIGMSIGLLGGLSSTFVIGGYTCLSHLALRLVLSRTGSLPFRLVPFLNYCTERIFLRKVGGGYIFVHRLLMEHFASLSTEQPEQGR